MKALLQRVSQARVDVAGECVGAIAGGLLVLVGVEPQDTPASADKLLHKLLNYRVFSDAAGKMNLSLKDVAGGLLLGVIEALGMHFTNPSLKSLLSYGVFIAALLWRPNGLFTRQR